MWGPLKLQKKLEFGLHYGITSRNDKVECLMFSIYDKWGNMYRPKSQKYNTNWRGPSMKSSPTQRQLVQILDKRAPSPSKYKDSPS